MATMRAVVCPKVPIPPTGLAYTMTHPKPAPKQDHVLIRVRAFGLNRSELFTRQGHSPGIEFPRVLGIECVGEVQDAGGSGRWKVGDKVAAIMGGMGRQFDGGYAEYTLVPQSCVSPPIDLPASVDWIKFASIPETYMTAWGTLSSSLNLSPSDTLLIRGGTTSVGLAAAALARSSLFGCARVIATTRNASKEQAMRASGVSDVVVEDSTGRIVDKVKTLTGGRGADKAIELVGGPTLTDTCQALSDRGVASMIGCVSGEWTVKEFSPFDALAPSKHLTFFGSNAVDMSTAPLQWIVNALDKGELKATVDKVFKMEQAGEAQAYMESNAAAGKVVCIVD